jgi:hypothetical protein
MKRFLTEADWLTVFDIGGRYIGGKIDRSQCELELRQHGYQGVVEERGLIAAWGAAKSEGLSGMIRTIAALERELQ